MIPILYDKTGNNKLGELNNCIECLVEEERNGIFEVSLVYPINDDIFNQLQEENIIVCNANDTLKSQKFRIYATKKLMTNKVEVYARHISFDLAYDRVDSINITNQSCEYALNTIFRQSQFSTNYRGHSDIINAQDYKVSNVNCIEAIAGVKGSIIDTYGTGAEILRDNTDIHVLNRRGHDNEVTIEYAKNLTGFELEEDYSELVTRINAFAKYTNSEDNTEHIVEAKNIDSPLLSNYSHPYITSIDYSDKFEQDEIPTQDKLIQFAKKEFTVNKKDMPKQNFKIEFIPLSKCVGYEELEDKISICDTVTIIDTRYDINTKAKVIRTVFNVLKDRYESMELGEPRTSLGDIIVTPGGGSDDTDKPQAGPQGPPGQDGTNGEDAIYLNLTNDNHIVPTLADGSGGNYTGCETEIELYKGADKILNNIAYGADGVEGVTGNLTGNVYRVTDMTVDNCNIKLKATYNQKTYVKYFNVSKSKKGQDGSNGEDGKTYYTWIMYADDSQGNGISNDPTGKKYIGFAYNKETKTESNNPKDYTWSLIKGTDGIPGTNGQDGTTYYTWIKYSDNQDGNPCYELPKESTKYIGIATNKTTQTESNNPKDYTWSKFKGDDGVQGPPGQDGNDGTNGKDAYTINISNDSHVFESESNGDISKEQTTTTKVLVFKGVDIASFEIGELPSVPGLELSKDTTIVTIKAVVGSALADTGQFEIPIIVDNLEFKKVFSWSKAKKGQDGSVGDFPDTLPAIPVLEAKVYGFASIELNWTYENKVYYSYELYASKTRDFTPNTFDLIHQGQTSSFLYQVLPNETWYFRVCAINSHGNRTEFSDQVEVTTRKIDDMSNYFEEAAIGKAVVGSLTADYMEAGIIKGNWIDAKNLSVTDGNGKRTLDIDSFGNVNLDVTTLKIASKDVATQEYTQSKIDVVSNSITSRVERVENSQSSIDGKLQAHETRITSAEQKITPEAIVSTVGNKFYTKEDANNTFASQSEIEQLSNQISSKVDESGVSSIIKQNSDAIRIGFNGIDTRTQIDSQGLSLFNDSGIKTTMLKLGNVYQYNGATGTFLGGYLSSRTSSSHNLGVVGSYNTKQWIVSRSSGWQSDNDNNPTNVTDYFFVNFVDIGSNKTGVHLASKTYAHNVIYMQSNNIDNAGNITCSNIEVGNDVDCYRVLAEKGMQTNVWYNSGGAQLMRYDGSKINLGASINTNGFSVSNSSDSRLKKDIQYVDETTYTSEEDNNLKKELYNEFKDKFKFATYRYKKEELSDKEHFGFIAQDLLGTVFEKYILDNPGSECQGDDYLRYDLTDLTTMIAGVLQEEISVRDKQIQDLETRLSKLEKLINV